MKLLEAIFRRFKLLLIMLFVPIIIGLGIGYFFPLSYQASASLWALQRYEIIGVTGAESDLTATPAQTQTNALLELLQSRSFDITVGNATDLKSTFNPPPLNTQKLDDAYVTDISKNVQVTSKGTNLYGITYTNNNPRIAAQVLKAVIAQFQLQGEQFSVVEGQRLLQGDEAQLTTIQKDADTATATESSYASSHPTATITNDPQYALLDGQRLQAQSTLQNMETTIATLKQDIATQNTGGGAFFKTLDAPVQPDQALSRSKNLLTTGGIGLAVGLIACLLYILITVRRDHALYTILDLEKVASYPILMQVPQISKARKELAISGKAK
jgi:hypothetical protein